MYGFGSASVYDSTTYLIWGTTFPQCREQARNIYKNSCSKVTDQECTYIFPTGRNLNDSLVLAIDYHTHAQLSITFLSTTVIVKFSSGRKLFIANVNVGSQLGGLTDPPVVAEPASVTHE